MGAQHINKPTANNSSTPAKMAKRRNKSAAAKQQKTPKDPFEGAVLIRACCGCTGAKPTRPKEEEEEGERKFYHNKKKLERLLNAKIYVKDEEEEKEKEKQKKKEDQPRSRTNHERCCHNKGNKTERALNDKEERADAEAIIKALDKWCKD